MIEPEAAIESDQAELTRLLEAAPRSVEAHFRMADHYARAGRDDLAIYFYRTGIELAEHQEHGPEASELKRAGEKLGRIQAKAHARREELLTKRGLPQDRWSPRLREALELAAGRRRLYRQQPTAFAYPGLPAIQFFDPAQFEWAGRIEAATPAIRDELRSALETNVGDLRAYVDHNSVAPEANRELMGSKAWSILPLCENGWLVPKIVERCPKTWEAVLQVPLPRISGWGPTVVFSVLRGGARIAPHTGMFNTRLICHLPLIVPPGCRFRVGNEVREWEEGKLLIFDDTIEHEAWNDSDEDRIVLIFDVWRPELTDHERVELTALFSD